MTLKKLDKPQVATAKNITYPATFAVGDSHEDGNNEPAVAICFTTDGDLEGDTAATFMIDIQSAEHLITALTSVVGDLKRKRH